MCETPRVSLFEIKLILTPLIVLAASLAARRWGDAIGGWLVGLPLTSAPVSVFLAVEQGRHFAAEAANGSLAGVVAQAVFCLGYAVFARRGVAAALAAGAVGYAILASALVAVGPPRFMLFLGAIVALTLVLRFVPRGKPTSAKAFSRLDITLRVAVTTGLVIGLTSAAGTLGPGASGAMASFPLIGASIAAFAHLAHGPAAGVSVMRGMATALYAFAVFFLIAGLALSHMATTAAFALATAGALIVQGATLSLLSPQHAAKGEAASSASGSNGA
ncbi:MAG: hypothetical protein JO223_22255 [Hyphomicrobiales bacterium]|nr:hypothetical protein [Hyphomicrobiales bacterium]MBV8440977.1 hypothetical protein [Hyphomicrobiales bacterium]